MGSKGELSCTKEKASSSLLKKKRVKKGMLLL